MADALSRPAAFGIGIAVFALDRASKFLVEQNISAFDSKPVIPGFLDIVKSQNPGVAFGILAGSTSTFRTTLLIVFSLGALIAVASMLWRAIRMDSLTAYGLSLIFGGALGNIFDRIIHGSVTDFLDVHFGSYHWYTFNLADSAITIGAALILLAMLRPAPVHHRKLES